MGQETSRRQGEQGVSLCSKKSMPSLTQKTLFRDLNRLVMDYLVIEGYKDAAEKFSIESGLKPNVDLESIQERMHIRSAVHAGDIEAAIERVNDLNPDVSGDRLDSFAPSKHTFITLVDTRHQSATLLPFATTTSDRTHPRQSNQRSPRICLRGTGLPRRRTTRVSLRIRTHHGITCL